MHFVGIKCEVCRELANCKDSINELPQGWMALVKRATLLNLYSRRDDLHFCSLECLCTWTREQVAKPRAVNE